MTTIDVTIGGETVELQVDDRFEELLEEVNAAVGREMSLDRFAAQTIRNSTTSFEQSIERSIVEQHQAIREAEDRGVELEQLAQSWDQGDEGD
jgi:CO dehydrogenase/acetyl-CoA synthase gamma subunit (corrinoid Fe-S protein)